MSEDEILHFISLLDAVREDSSFVFQCVMIIIFRNSEMTACISNNDWRRELGAGLCKHFRLINFVEKNANAQVAAQILCQVYIDWVPTTTIMANVFKS